MNEVPSRWPFQFAIIYSDDELRTYRKVVAARYARGDDWGWIFAVPLIGLVVLGAFELGLVTPTTIRSVLFTSYAAFILGAASHYLFVRRHFRKLTRNNRWRGRTWNWSVDETGVRYCCETTDVRLAWSALDAVEDLGRMVLFTIGQQTLCIPSRIFADNAARLAFVAAATARIKAAAQG